MTAPTDASAVALRISAIFYREADPDWQVAEHHHDVHQWYICLHGGLRIRAGASLHQIGPERSLIVLPRTPRELVVLRRAPGYLVVIFDPVGIDIAKLADRPLTLPPALRDDLHALIEELRRPGEDHALLVRALLLRLLIGHKRDLRLQEPAVSVLNAHSHGDVVAQAEDFMRVHLTRQLRRSEIAAAVHLSEVHLARVFKAATGVSVLRRLTDLRIARAKSLLLESRMSVGQIAGEVGIVSFSHFAHTFKRLVGVSPGDYRRTGGTSWGDRKKQ